MSPPVADSTKDGDKKAVQRRINKPLIEKRRRARINDCLVQLKAIVLEASESKSPRPSKLEKADILEMTVDFIKKKSSEPGHQPRPLQTTRVQGDYVAGYSKCLTEISSFLEQTRSVNATLKQDIVEHISTKLQCQIAPNNEPIVNKERIPSPRNVEDLGKGSEEAVSTDQGSEHEAIDLRVRHNASNIAQPILPDMSKQTAVVDESNRNNITQVSQFANPGIPIGLLCGGQVMLVVLPSTMTSQNVSTTLTSSCQQPIKNSSVSIQQPSSIAPVPDSNITPAPDSTLSQNSNVESMVVQDTLIGTNSRHSDANNLDVNKVDTESSNVSNNQTQPVDCNPDHWRPW